jgi:ubiquinone/menaquinone biosynthesis C-methylase UbiE
MYILSGGTLGIDPSAPFLEVQLSGTDKAHGKELPVCLFTVNLTECQDTGYNRRSEPIIEEEIIDSPMNLAIADILKKLGRDNLGSDNEDRQHLKQKIDLIQPSIQALQSKLRDWGEASDTWVKEFNFQLSDYSRIYATDYYPRSSIENPRFKKYLHEQFAARLERLSSKSDNFLRFSQPIYDAIIRTNWQPDQTMWSKYKIGKIENSSQENLEIVRILIRPKATLQERQVLENLDFEHRMFAIPLFVLDSEKLNSNELIDFAIGFNKIGKAIRSYEFIGVEGKVKEVNSSQRGLVLQEFFERMLSNGSLKTVIDFNRHGLMITDRTDALAFAATYDNTRKPSEAILEKMRQNLHPVLSEACNGIEYKTIGVDIGCGTGNYTIPFIDQFDQVIGIDISKEMLDKAKEKSNKVKWIERDALDTRLPDKYCDAVWLISSLHYFIGDGQKILFKEIYRILKKGGVVFADTEFKEQHDSLWLVEFFPSLRDRYKNVIFSTKEYKTLLNEIGFSDIRFEYITTKPDDKDAALRIGQHDPKRYLQPGLLEGIPAFKEMDPYAFSEGMRKLRAAIEDGTIDKITKRYNATMEGDDGFIIATRPT